MSDKKYTPTIGLEIHVELKTRTKMFCACLNDSEEKHPNVNVCPVCMGHPGTLPVANEEAIKKVLLVGKALNGQLAEYSQFDRKNYFYPDIPKGYQISQYKYPLVSGGELAGVKITRVHLEEDTGSLMHENGDNALVNFNRAGVPLMELVTEPVIHSSAVAKKFAEELRLVLRYLNVSDADMEKGQMRVEANISVSLAEQSEGLGGCGEGQSKPVLGTKTEVKNLNSFRAAERAIEYEIERQTELLEKGEKIKQETRGWDENNGKTFSQREKESSHDYRYFPDPDLPVMDLKKWNLDVGVLPELPQVKRERLAKEYGLKDEAVEFFVQDKKFAEYFEEAVSELKEWIAKPEGKNLPQLAANYLLTDLQGLMKEKMLVFEDLQVNPENFAELVKMVNAGEITSRVGKDVLRMMVESGGDPSVIVDEKGLRQNNDEGAIIALAEKLILENPTVIEEYKKGKEASLQFLVGKAMKETKGSVNPQAFLKILKEKIGV